MITRKTVLVLGAGASKPYGFPTGAELKDFICYGSYRFAGRDFLRDFDAETLCHLGIAPNEVDKLTRSLNSSGRASVDAFLESRPDLLQIGKIMIARALLPIEQPKLLFQDWPRRRANPNSADRLMGNWYELLFGALTEGTSSFEELDLRHLKIITFNYDRSLEHFLFTAIANAYYKHEQEGKLAAKLGEMTVLHVHGSLGMLPWQATDKEENSVPYQRTNPSVRHLQLAANGIKVLHEDDAKSPESEQARAILADGECLYFLGFGYHRRNMERLGINVLGPKGNVGGTMLGISYATQRRLESSGVLGFERGSFRYQEKDVYEFLHDHVDLGA